ncbi:hypothetical protein BDA96_05G137700 [Sorghum bicolor]|uniref:RIN4 pathogenic type III effector avirulence factor Avr cleavage site domain-containing protein n=2 Tax=Sorghum bicolor TaxID=4558 RepID=A0A921R0A4_SORBI|nr:uncharacterized protein LOC8055026 isoform X2 [Sorghum bicolor]KAG0529905.1 hypothetical protein BDA96_05G137700 [Sorghum bicolor]KXG28458.1 hypothetical protein SORBI_3005G125300 [Sorghum bicolor]|eukprot:XP_021317463.1 uncharacterized protein LOC8055026 isoform X2 [Sorghum bicolor]
MKKKATARRQRIPAFGEWNYAYVGAGDWPVTQYFDSAMQAGRLVMAIPPPSPPKPAANKWRESSGTLELEDEDEDEDEKQRQQHVVAVGHGGAVKKQGKQQQQQQSPVAHAYSKACRRVGAAAAVVKAMDQDLYHIPPDMLCHEPRKRVTRRSLWMGCLGLDCVA